MVHLRCEANICYFAAIHGCDAHLILKSSMGKDKVKKRRRPLKYTYLSYQDIVHRLEYLSRTYPHICRVYTAQDKYSLPSAGKCEPGEGDESKPCKQFIVEVGNSNTIKKKHPTSIL